MGKKIKKTLAKFDLGHQAAKGFGLPDPSGDALYGSEKKLSPAESAEEQAKLTRRQTEQQNQLLQQTQKNLATSLSGENIANVVAGGTAEAASEESGLRKRRRPGGLTAALGV